MPSYSEILKAQQQLGLPFVVWILIAGATAYLGVKALQYLFNYLEESKIQEQTTARNAQQLEGYSTQTKARLDCYTQCVAKGGNTDAGCVSVCAKLIVNPPELATGAQRAEAGLSFFSTVGLVAVAALGGFFAFKFIRKDHVVRVYDAAARDAG